MHVSGQLNPSVFCETYRAQNTGLITELRRANEVVIAHIPDTVPEVTCSEVMGYPAHPNMLSEQPR